MKFRHARHTSKMNLLKDFYTQIIGLDFLGEFKNHAGYDGIFIGKINSDWHLEFTQNNETANHTFDEDDLLVFYPETDAEFEVIKQRIDLHKIERIIPKNPYWKENGILILDPDGYRVVISNGKIK